MGSKKKFAKAKSLYFIQRRTAYRKVRWYYSRKQNKSNYVANYGVSIVDAIKFFAADNNLEITGNPKEWIVSLYISGENEHIRRLGNLFYGSPEWIRLREEILGRYGSVCMKCGETEGIMHVDHIKPRSKYPELQLNPDNLQVLCQFCNLSKGARNEIDYRPESKAI